MSPEMIPMAEAVLSNTARDLRKSEILRMPKPSHNAYEGVESLMYAKGIHPKFYTRHGGMPSYVAVGRLLSEQS